MIQFILLAKSHFEEDCGKNYSVFHPIYRYFKIIADVDNDNYIYYWKSKGLPEEKINSITSSNHSITPKINYFGTKTRVEFNGKWEFIAI